MLTENTQGKDYILYGFIYIKFWRLKLSYRDKNKMNGYGVVRINLEVMDIMFLISFIDEYVYQNTKSHTLNICILLNIIPQLELGDCQ